MMPDEYERILPGDIIQRYSVISHNIDDEANFVSLGETTRRTPILVNRLFYQSSLKIVTGNIEPHHFAGFSGGYKTASIGLGGRTTINKNHVMLMDPDARIAEFGNNPLRQDIEEIGEHIGVHFALNVILNGDKKIVSAVSGSPRAVMSAGIPMSQGVCQTSVSGERYDLVIASVGGAPKDINFYQSQKALTHASLFTRDGGVILLAAACPEGSGSQSYEQFMVGLSSPLEVFKKFQEVGFKVGPHKAFQVARDAARVRIVLLSQIPADLVSRLLMTPAGTPQEAYQEALGLLGASSHDHLRVAVLPRATNTVPVWR
jgi:nickel-dependent lactate racemase